MARASMPLHTARDRLAEARERFLAAEPVDPNAVRKPILASWWRSRQWHVAADHIELDYLRDPDLESNLARTADPVLRHLHEQLDGQPISIILTDAAGLVLTRMTADHDLERHLDGVKLAPGFSYAEERVGTNGIGTALESGGPAHVFGHEHYAEHLEGLACAGVPIHDPVSGKTVGVIDLTCWRKNADPLLVSLVKSTADQITQALLAAGSSRDLHLLQEYVRACRRTGGIVLALGNNVVMLNDHARQVLDPGRPVRPDRPRHRGAGPAEPGRGDGRPAQRRGGPDVLPADLGRQPVRRRRGPRQAGGRGRGRARGARAEGGHVPAGPGRQRRAVAARLPGGGDPLRRRGLDDARGRERRGQAGPGPRGAPAAQPGRAVPRARRATDADQDWLTKTRGELLDGAGMLVIRHVDALNAKQMHALASALQEARTAKRHKELRVAVTLNRKQASADLTRLLRFFQGTVELPPLRHHIEDLHELVPFFLARLSQQGRLTCSPEAMQLLLRHNWPGNAEQLWQVLKQVVQRRRAGVIMPKDLPPECWTVSRRLLSPLESIERDAIVQSLQDHDGNKVRAAEALGMSRATIYRKIHEYGIVAAGS